MGGSPLPVLCWTAVRPVELIVVLDRQELVLLRDGQELAAGCWSKTTVQHKGACHGWKGGRRLNVDTLHKCSPMLLVLLVLHKRSWGLHTITAAFVSRLGCCQPTLWCTWHTAYLVWPACLPPLTRCRSANVTAATGDSWGERPAAGEEASTWRVSL